MYNCRSEPLIRELISHRCLDNKYVMRVYHTDYVCLYIVGVFSPITFTHNLYFLGTCTDFTRDCYTL